MPVEAHDLGDGVRAYVIRSDEEFIGFWVMQSGLEEEEARGVVNQQSRLDQQKMLVMFVHSDEERTFSRVLMPYPDENNTMIWGLVETGDTDVAEDITAVHMPFSSGKVTFERDDKIFRKIYDDGAELPDPRLMKEIPRSARMPGCGLE